MLRVSKWDSCGKFNDPSHSIIFPGLRFNSLKPAQNGLYLQVIFSNAPSWYENKCYILNWISLKAPNSQFVNGCLLKRLFRRRSKKTSKLRVAGLYVGNSPGPVNSPHKGPVTRKMFPFDDVIMYRVWIIASHNFQRDMIASIPRYWSDQCDVSNHNKDRQHDDLSVSVDLIGVLDRHWGEDLNEWLYPTVFVDVISYSVMMLM